MLDDIAGAASARNAPPVPLGAPHHFCYSASFVLVLLHVRMSSRLRSAECNRRACSVCERRRLDSPPQLHVAAAQLLVVVLRRCSTIVSLARVCGSATQSCTSHGLYRENQYKRRETWCCFPIPQEANAGGAVGKALTSAISLAGALLH